MAKIRREGKKEVPAISTASLPDIIFMLLFFFMATTSMKEVTYKVDIHAPEATYRDWETDRKSTRLNSRHITRARMPSSA